MGNDEGRVTVAYMYARNEKLSAGGKIAFAENAEAEITDQTARAKKMPGCIK